MKHKSAKSTENSYEKTTALQYVIIRKLEYFREGDSQKHLDDIKKMLPQVRDEMDWTFLENEINTRGLSSVWNKLQSQGSQF